MDRCALLRDMDVIVTRVAPTPRVAAQLLALLPEWFGIESAVQEYVEAAARLPTYVARVDGPPPVGILLIAPHFPEAAELHLLAVHPQWHRRGIGRRLVATAEADLVADGVRLRRSRPSARPEPTRTTRAPASSISPWASCHSRS